jgi:hypothetical protein
MKIAFLTEMGFIGKVPADHKNMRTEFAWMNALDADHIPLFQYNRVAEYDFIFIIWPKADVLLNAEGVKMSDIKKKLFSQLINTDIIGDLKQRNSKVFFVQEGPTWFSNDYNIAEQIYHHNLLNESDAIFCHNEWDAKWYKGLAANTPVYVMPTLMCDELVKGILVVPLLRAINRLSSSITAKQQDQCVGGSHFPIQHVARGMELLKMQTAVYGKCGKKAAEEQNFSAQKQPHAKLCSGVRRWRVHVVNMRRIAGAHLYMVRIVMGCV